MDQWQNEGMIPEFDETLKIVRFALAGDLKSVTIHANFLVQRLSRDGYHKQAERLRKSINGEGEELYIMEANTGD